ncbi:MAG TPA: hypothetical protein DEE98_06040 [Elusimicrobia bacterium]|nr:MAG: hypothetical protein A2278_08970 [Elusimicrobia bacterium RIFOXYA12_FULL_49_49]OGS06269.1 MAG: hypothetical protein A2204_05950 [Elusimicrobia bacterium RIFOXYA1_FULL_47_7]OGS11907.1 MAG: hypothetical protein A2386_08470 [Elusimicrobia bacterium RIFOXYB1_FULL_48_9]OGS14917.1 MAG: hypothetical protein A2251_07825 [Elusimicrobia bacterium RIFOXYA2_FULL_47_53]OGS26148.1 MAG: hypothetical protein A2339_02450 [Elusimicrobia bacterium RIFOXYB12_FULL_50_12]OGS29262.1 MAG: hypothetical protein
MKPVEKIIHIVSLAIFMSVVAAASSFALYGGMPGDSGGSGTRRGKGKMSAQARPASAPLRGIDTSDIREILGYEKELKLTSAQVEEINSARQELLRESAAKYESLSEPQKEAAKLLNKVEPDFNGARGKIEQIMSVLCELPVTSLKYYEKAYNSLTREQKEAFFNIRAAKAQQGRGPAQDNIIQ